MGFYFVRGFDGKSAILESKEYPKGYQSTHGAFLTMEECVEKACVFPEPCSCCGELFTTNYCEPTKSELMAQKICFHCHFWKGYVREKDNPKFARIKGTHYCVEKSANVGRDVRWNGFGGTKFTVRWMDGRQESTNNLWCQGDIPDRFKNDLPDNAEFINKL